MAHSSFLTAVMYHYVRPLAKSAFPRLKALELADFETQLDYLSTAYNIISPAALSANLLQGAPLPERPCILTFDDGYSDHYEYVFPALQARGLTGLFFAPHSSLIERKMLEVNKVQFILACNAQPNALAAELDAILSESRGADITALRAAHFSPNRYDGPEVAYFKRLLQHALPCEIRSKAIDQLFQRHVTADPAEFTENLYLSVAQAQEMRAAGNEFGGHGGRHLWHALASPEDLDREIADSAVALKAIGAPITDGYYCYPFGSNDQTVRSAVADAGFRIGFTVDPRLFALEGGDSLRISRLDTNDLPKSTPVHADPWLTAAQRGVER